MRKTAFFISASFVLTLPVRKVFGTHTFYEGEGGGWADPHDFENDRLYNLQF